MTVLRRAPETAPVPPAEAKAESSRGRMLEAAIAILSEGGYGALSVSEICGRAGVAPTSLYHHFGSKAGLMAAVIRFSLERDRARYRTRIQPLAGHRAQLGAYLSVLREMILEGEPSTMAVLAALGEGRGAAPEIAGLIAEARKSQFDLAAAEFSRVLGVKDGLLFAHAALSLAATADQVYRDTRDVAAVDAILGSLAKIIALIGFAQMPGLAPGTVRDILSHLNISDSQIKAIKEALS